MESTPSALEERNTFAWILEQLLLLVATSSSAPKSQAIAKFGSYLSPDSIPTAVFQQFCGMPTPLTQQNLPTLHIFLQINIPTPQDPARASSSSTRRTPSTVPQDLKNANPSARISVKLVARIGIGVIASGRALAGRFFGRKWRAQQIVLEEEHRVECLDDITNR